MTSGPRSRLALWAAALLSVSCQTYVSERAESSLLVAMPRVLGPADRYEATVRGANTSASHFDLVRVVGVRVQRPKTPVIDRFEATLREVSVDRPNKQVTAIGTAQAVVRVTAADLQSHVERQGWIGQPRVRLLPPDGITVTGLLEVPVAGATLSSSASFTGRLVPSGSRLLIAVDALSLGDRQAPPLLRSWVGAAVNPLFDLSAYAVPSTIDRVSVQDDAIRLEASGSRMQVNRPR
jgi:hypothetical protein